MFKYPVQIERHVLIPFFAFLAMVVCILAAYGTWFGFHLKIPASESAETWGQFGDYVGGVLNPLIGGLTLMWLIRSVHLQKTELAETREALVATQHAQEEQTRLTYLTAKRETLNLKLSSVVSQLGHQQSTMNVWLTQIANNETYQKVVNEKGEVVDVRIALSATRSAIERLENEREKLIAELDCLIEEAEQGANARQAA